jgi:hypothetical protein
VNSGKTYARHRRGGRFFGRRVNCEYVPRLPAAVVREVVDDPRKIPYLLVWKNERTGEVQEAVRVNRCVPQRPGDDELVEVKRISGTLLRVHFAWRRMPRNGGRNLLLFCWHCGKLRTSLYGWEAFGPYTTSARISDWQCRSCAGLRYASEGGALVLRSRGSWFRRLEMEYGTTRSQRPEPWYPYVFSNPADASAAGFC